MTTRRSVLAAACFGALAFLAGYGVHVLAEGVPSDQPLFYSGTLEADGQPASGPYTITVSLYDAATGGEALCTASSETELANGRFRIDASACADAVRAEPDVWVGVAFEGEDGAMREIAGRSKVGAVPYALEAEHAMSASAAAGGLQTTIAQLGDRLEALEEAVQPRSAFQAQRGSAQTIAPGGSYVIFDEVQFDLAGEYDPATGTFEAERDGFYEFWCNLAWSIDDATPGYIEAQLHVGDFEAVYAGHYGPGVAATRSVRAVLELEAGQTVRCNAFQGDLGMQELNPGSRYLTFGGRRLPL
jgi:hypothetical protein